MKNASVILYFIVAVILCVGAHFAFDLKYNEEAPLFLYISFFFFASISTLSHFTLKTAVIDKPQEFITRYMGITALKLFLILSVLTIYLWFNKEHLFAVGLSYAGAYLLFLILDTVTLLKQLNSKN